MTGDPEPARCGHVQVRSPLIRWVCIARPHPAGVTHEHGGNRAGRVTGSGHYFIRVTDSPPETP